MPPVDDDDDDEDEIEEAEEETADEDGESTVDELLAKRSRSFLNPRQPENDIKLLEKTERRRYCLLYNIMSVDFNCF